MHALERLPTPPIHHSDALYCPLNPPPCSKFPDYPAATAAFQKVSFAYETLSKPSSRRMYDVSGRTDFAAAMNNSGDPQSSSAGLGDDTLNGVLYSVFCEFMEGDFEMIRVLVNALNEGNPSMNLGDDAVDSIEGVFRRLREVMFAGKRYLSIIKFELIRLYEIQQALRQLSYFNITGRLKLTLQLARVTINIPLAIDQAMKQPEGDKNDANDAAGQNGTGATHAGVGDERSELSDSSSDEDDGMSDDATGRKRTSRRQPAEDAFGVAEEDSGSDDDSYARAQEREQASQRRRARRARRREQRRQARARIRHERANSRTAAADGAASDSEENKQQQLQRRGLLPSTAVGLLKGVVRVLETSEAWVPGGK